MSVDNKFLVRDKITLKVTGLGSSGEGVGKTDGFTVFAHGALADETVEVELEQVKKNYASGKVTAILEASPERVEPLCPVYEACGGCQLQHLNYTGQLKAKEQQVRDALFRIGHLQEVKVLPIIGEEDPWHYRNKMQFPVAFENGILEIGCYAAATHKVVGVENCLIQKQRNNDIIAVVRQWMRQYEISAYDEKTGKGVVRHVMGRVGVIGQSPFDEVVDYCDQQMLEAANALPAIYDDPSKYGRINKIMALTVRSRMLLFAASPLVNGNEWYKDYRNKAGELVFNPTYDPNKWVKAAEACKLCIDEAEKAGYKLYVETGPTGENDPFMSTYNVHIKKWSEGNREITFPVTKGNGYFDFFLYGASTREFSGGGGQGVYQGLVDAFFTRRGLPILEDESYSEKGFSENVDKRNTSWSYGTGKEGEITAAGIYKMYCNREPRFYNAVSFHGSWQECAKRPYDFFYNGKDNIRTSSPHDAPQNGYLVRKSLCMTDNKKTGVYTSRQGFTYRLAFTYLDYAEANNEAYDTSAARELCLKYLNKVRERAGVRQYTFDAVSDLDENFIHIENTQAAVRKVVKAERRVELCLENNRWYDLRRWKDVENTPEMIGDDYGMNSEGTTNETFFKRTVYQTRVWKRCYYWMPVFIDEYEKNPNLVQTPFWLE